MQKLPPEIIDKIYSYTTPEICIRDKKWYALTEWIDSGKVNMDWASEGGHLDLVKYLHITGHKECTTDAMEKAAKNGHLEIVKYLHTICGAKCAGYAMDFASANGHLEIVKYLHEEGSVKCTADTIKWAAAYGYVDIVKYLHIVGGAECTNDAITLAVIKDHDEVIEYLNSIHIKRILHKHWTANMSHSDWLLYLYDKNRMNRLYYT